MSELEDLRNKVETFHNFDEVEMKQMWDRILDELNKLEDE